MQDFDGIPIEDGDDGGVISNASTAEEVEMKKPKVGIERLSSLLLEWRATRVHRLRIM